MTDSRHRPRRYHTSQWPLWRTAWRRLRRRPLQYALFVLGVALGVAMMVSVDLASGSASRAFQLSTDAIVGRTTHRIFGGPAGLDERVYRQLRTANGIRPAAPIVEGYGLVPELGDQPLRLVGVDPFAEPPFRDFLAPREIGGLDGLVPFLTMPRTVILSADLAATYGVRLGDEVTFDRNGRRHTLRVVGLLRPADESAGSLDGVLFVDLASAQELLDMLGRLSHIDLILPDAGAIDRVAALLPPQARLEPAAAAANTVQQMSAAFNTNLTALSLLALVVGMFLIYNTVTFSVVQRRPLFGVLRCLGVTGRQLFRLILAEAAVLSLAGAVLGLLLGVVLGRFMVGLVTQTINDFYFVVSVRDVAVPPLTLAKGVLVGLGAALAAALFPALEAWRTAPQAGLRRSALEAKATRLVPWLILAWLLLSLAGALLLALGGRSLVLSFAGLFAVLIGAALLAPPLTVLLMRQLTPATGRLFGALGRLAPRDIVRSLSRTSVAIAALMTAVSVIVGVSIMIGSFRQTVSSWLSETLQADIFVSPPTLTASRVEGTLDPATVTTIQSWPGVTEVVTARQVDVPAPALGRRVELNAISGDISRGDRRFVWAAAPPDEIWARFLAGEGIMISEPLLLREGLGLPPPPLLLQTDQGPRRFPILAVSYDYSSDQGGIAISDTLYRQLWDDPAVTTLALFVAGRPVATVLAELQTAFAGRSDLILQSNQSVRQNALNIFDRTFAITAALQLLATVVAFIGVLSALLSLQLERARELGVLRATGMTRRQLWRLTFIETGLMGGTAGLLALPTGYVLAWILVYVINVRSFGWTLQMQLEPGYFLQALAVAVIAALLAGIFPALRLSQMTIATAVRQE